MDRKDLDDLNRIQLLTGFKSRSKMFRSALQSLENDYIRIGALNGNVEIVFAITYPDGKRRDVSDILHGFENDISMSLHHHHTGTCVEILSLHTTANVAKRFFDAVKRCKSIKTVTYIVI